MSLINHTECLCRFGRTASVCYPPDTPGFEEEQKSKGLFTYDVRKITPSLPLVLISPNLSVLFSCQIWRFLNPLPLSVQTSYANVPKAGGVQDHLGVGEQTWWTRFVGKVTGKQYA